MLFIIAIAVVTLALGATGLRFEDSLAVAIAAMTNTGPAISVLDPAFSYRALNGLQLAILDLTMVVGRLEVLVVVALMNVSLWRQ
jgi:trk system potassium uptake protein TrkH